MRGWPMVLAMIGCYGDQRELLPDAAPIDDPRELVSLRFIADEVDLAGFPVYFQNADGSIALATRTDTRGVARAVMLDGGFVTLVLPSGRAYTYANVRGGDQLVVDEADNNTERRAVSVHVPPSPNANVYAMFTSCGVVALDKDAIAQGTPAIADLIGCGATSDVVITASSTEPQPFGSNHRYLFMKDAPLDSMSLVFDEAFAPVVDSEVTVTAMPAPSRVTLTQMLVRDRESITQPKSTTVDVVGGVATGRITRNFAPSEGLTLTRVQPQPIGLSTQTTLVWGPSTIETDIAVGERSLRAFTAEPVLAASSVTWTEEPVGERGDLVFVELSWQPPSMRSQTWKLLAPRGDATSVQFPIVPTLVVPETAWITQLATFAVDAESIARTTLLGGWPGNDAHLADHEAGRADVRVMN